MMAGLWEWSGRMDLNHRPPGPEPGALARLRYAPTDILGRNLPSQGDYQINTALPLKVGCLCVSSQNWPANQALSFSSASPHQRSSTKENRRETLVSRRLMLWQGSKPATTTNS